MILTAKEFRKVWQQQNPKVIHIPSEHELGLMEQYAKYYHEQQVKNCSIPDVVGQSEQLICDVCGSTDVIEATHMGRNCNRCHPL